MKFNSVLFLDDLRTPSILGIDVVRNYDEFVWFIKNKPMPDLISFDHDLSVEHYPTSETDSSNYISYDSYKEKTGYHCAKYLVDNNIRIYYWRVHSLNPVGKSNIESLLRTYNPSGEVKGLELPYFSNTNYQR